MDDLASPAALSPGEHADPMVSEVFARSPEVAAVLISHAHADHTGLLHLVPPGVPIFLSKGTSKMMLAGLRHAFSGNRQLGLTESQLEEANAVPRLNEPD